MATRMKGTSWLMAVGLALVLVGLVTTGMTFAQTQQGQDQRPMRMGRMGPGGPGGPGFGMGRPGPMGMFGGFPMRALDLTDQQREQVDALVKANQETFKALADRMMPARQALQEAVMAEPLNEQAIRDASARVAAIEADMAVEHARLRTAIFDQVLTPDQRAKARELHEQRVKNMEQREQRMRRGPGGVR